MQHVVSLTLVYFGVYLLLSLLRSFAELRARTPPEATAESNLEAMLKAALPSFDLIPMLCVLFLAVRFRSVESQKDLLPPYCSVAMAVATFAVVVQSVVCVLIPYFSGEVGQGFDVKQDSRARMQQSVQVEVYRSYAKNLTLIKFVCVGFVYGGVIAVCVGILAM